MRDCNIKNRREAIWFFIVFAAFFTVEPIILLMHMNEFYATEPVMCVVFIVAFCGSGVAFQGFVVAKIIRVKRNKRFEKEGETYTAKFLSYSTKLVVNGERKYRIKYAWKDNMGNVYEG